MWPEGFCRPRELSRLHLIQAGNSEKLMALGEPSTIVYKYLFLGGTMLWPPPLPCLRFPFPYQCFHGHILTPALRFVCQDLLLGDSSLNQWKFINEKKGHK